MDETASALEPKALEALRKTRPWMLFLAVVTVIICAVMLIVLIAGIAGHATHPARANEMIGGGIAGLIVCIPIAVVQFGYAMALSDVEQARPGELERAIERACVRQRNLWIVTAVVTALAGLGLLLQTLALLF